MSIATRFIREDEDRYLSEHYEDLTSTIYNHHTIDEAITDQTYFLEDNDRLKKLTTEQEFLFADHPATHSNNLDCLADYTEHESLRTAIAYNEQTAPKTLHLLAQISVSEETFTALIENAHTRTETLIMLVLAEDVPLHIKEKVVKHYRFVEVTEELIETHGVERDCFPPSWKRALSKGKY